ncbi:U2 snRNP-associated SURP motif-containing protein isoform X3 [Acanthochromis polyacanthus]|uniref:U2 snRNP-associated SURP motif-containing protein isoform X3 n=1 Tax=Acanthochromis polyacanthus TaxID=80966 RepID=UPI002234D5A3|nr:U2 snRNP-associated SURP motif-containing protein isoform X3 [Acanthochromis polyacanthus]
MRERQNKHLSSEWHVSSEPTFMDDIILRLSMAERKGKPATPIKTLTKKEKVELKKKEEEKAAEVFEEFLASFETSEKNKVKTFVRGGIVNATKEEEAEEVGKSKVYRPSTKFVPTSQHVSPVSSAESKKSTFKKKTEEKKKSNLELFKEELKLIQEEREERHKRKKSDPGGAGGGERGYGDLDIPLSGRSTLYDDLTVPTTTNLYISCISQKMNEEMLCKEFCKYGPLASVKIMWPRTEEERGRTSNRAFVAFMTRKDAERALAALDGKVIMGFEMKLGWGKPARIPPQPLYTPVGLRATPPPPSGLPFNAQPRDRFRNDFTKPLGMSKTELDKTLSEAVVKVVIPTERNLLFLIHRMIEFVVREGPMFEAIIMNKEKNNPDYRFLFDNKSQNHVYYRWKLFSILQGESPTEWRTTDFRMFRGGSLWRPPVLNNYSQRSEERAEAEDSVSPEEEEVKKGQLRAEHRQRLELLLKELTPSREDIANAMLFCLDRADAAEEVVGHITDSFSLLQTPLQKKIARLYLVSDILHNSCAKVVGASYYRKYFETKLTQIFGDLNAAHKNIQARLQAEQFKQKVMSCFRAWEDWAIYPGPYLIHLQNIFLGFAKAGEESTETVEEAPCDLDGAPLDGTLIDGLPLDRTPVDDLDGCPMGWDPLDGVPVDDIDGVPLGASIDDIDGMPYESNALLSRVPLSKWEKAGDTRTCSQVKTESKWDTVVEQDSEDEVNVSGNSQDGDEDSESDSSADSCNSSNYDSAVFQSSLRSFEMSESKRKRLRELEVKVMKIQDELESGKRQRKSGMSIQQQVEHYRNKLLQKEFQKDDEKNERSVSKSKERSKEDRRNKERSKRNEDGDRRRSSNSGDQSQKSSISPSKSRSPKRSKRSRSPSPDKKAGKSRSRSPHRSHKKSKKSKH